MRKSSTLDRESSTFHRDWSTSREKWSTFQEASTGAGRNLDRGRRRWTAISAGGAGVGFRAAALRKETTNGHQWTRILRHLQNPCDPTPVKSESRSPCCEISPKSDVRRCGSRSAALSFGFRTWDFFRISVLGFRVLKLPLITNVSGEERRLTPQKKVFP